MARRFGIGFAFPLLLAAIALAAQGQLDEAFYWVVAFNATHYKNLAGMGPTLEQLLLLFCFVAPLLILRWDRRLILLGFVALTGLTTLIPRYGESHLLSALPALSVLVGIASVRHGRLRHVTPALVVALTVMGGLSLLLRGDYGDTLTMMESHVATFQAITGATADTTVWLLPENDSRSAFYVIGEYQPISPWSPSYPWFYAPDTGVVERTLATLSENSPPFAIRYYTHRELLLLPPEFEQFLRQHYIRIGAIPGGDVYMLR